MRRVIYKYVLLLPRESGRRDIRIKLPLYSKVLSAHRQGTTVCIWVEINPDITQMEERIFACYMTGELVVDCQLRFISTVLLEDGSLIFHVYEKIG